MHDIHTIQSDKVNRLRKYRYHVKTVLGGLRRGASLGHYIQMAVPPRLRFTTARPHALYLEFSTRCDIACEYCPCPTYDHHTPFMREDVLRRIVEELRKTPVNKLLIGGGEPTLHPEFKPFLEALRPHARFITVVTNGQWQTPAPLAAIASGLCDMLEVSLDAGGQTVYENARQRASYTRLLANLREAYATKRTHAPDTIVNVRLMLRPSTSGLEHQERERLTGLCDTVIPQYITHQYGSDCSGDVFLSSHELQHTFPKCSYPFRALHFKTDGTVPLCSINGHNDEGGRIILGNILTSSMHALWHSPALNQYRAAHRNRTPESMPACRGCLGG